MRPRRRSTKTAGGVSQGGLRSHSDNHLASASQPGFSVESLGGMDRTANPATRRAELRGPLDVVSAGHREGPWLIWCHRRAKAARPALPAALPAHRRDTAKSSVCEGNFTNALFTHFCQSSKHLGMVSKRSSDYSQMWIPLTFHWIPTNTPAYQRSLAAPLWLPHTQHSRHNELAAQHHAGASRLFTPQKWSLWFGRLISFAGPPLPVCPSARLSAQVTGVRGDRRVQ